MRLIRIQAVVDRTGLSRPTIYRQVARGEFPRPVKMGPQASAWVEDEVNAHITAKADAREKAS